MDTGQWLTRGTVWLALTLYVIAEIIRMIRSSEAQPRLARVLSTMGCAAFIVHVACAFHFYHRWSHAAAYADTARQTEEYFMWNWGGGLYFNYAFLLLWVVQSILSWTNQRHAVHAPTWVGWVIRGFVFMMLLNGAVIFAHGWMKGYGLVLSLGLAFCWWPRGVGRAVTAVAVVISIVAVVLTWRAIAFREPSYGGRPLHAWLQQYRNAKTGYARQEAEQALRQMTRQALPVLLRYIEVKDTRLKQQLRNILPRQWHDRLRLVDNSGYIRRLGANGIQALGTNAAPAAPALIELATHHTEADGRYIAVYGLRKLAPVSEPVVPFLITRLTNSDSIVRDEAAIGLGGVRDRPDVIVPLLIQYLKFAQNSPHAYECKDTIGLLGGFGTNAQAATPLLLGLLEHANREVRSQVTNWLPAIDVEAAAKAGITVRR